MEENSNLEGGSAIIAGLLDPVADAIEKGLQKTGLGKVAKAWIKGESTVLLLGLLIVRFIMFLFPRQHKINYALSYFSLVLFSLFMLYDTKKLIKKAKQCVKADYINDSLGVVLDSLNIFSNLFHLGE